MATSYFSPATFRFLKDLKAHNDRAWFSANKTRYEEHVKAPALAFIGDMGPRLKDISRHYVADPRPVGGSLFRLHRDVRFSRDKSPYKDHVGIQFRRATNRDVHAPGFYVHLQPGSVFVAAGVWQPEPPVLARIRDHIVARPDAWKRAVRGLSLWGESLQRGPRGYDPEHPLLDDLRRKDFITSMELDEKAATRPDFLARVVKCMKKATPLMAFLCDALDMEF